MFSQCLKIHFGFKYILIFLGHWCIWNSNFMWRNGQHIVMRLYYFHLRLNHAFYFFNLDFELDSRLNRWREEVFLGLIIQISSLSHFRCINCPTVHWGDISFALFEIFYSFNLGITEVASRFKSLGALALKIVKFGFRLNFKGVLGLIKVISFRLGKYIIRMSLVSAAEWIDVGHNWSSRGRFSESLKAWEFSLVWVQMDYKLVTY